MKRYSLIVEKTGTRFSAWSPDISGCAGLGATEEEARRDFQNALDCHDDAEVIEGKIREYRPASARQFWGLLSPEKSLFSGPSKVLYRGQASESWRLTPSLFRPDNNPAVLIDAPPFTADVQIMGEWMSLDSFREHCDSSGLRIPNDSTAFRAKYFEMNKLDVFRKAGSLWPDEGYFEVMALARHHRLPSRLLDWSRRSYVAAYFAASDALANASDASVKRFAVWALNIEMRGLFRELEIVRIPGSNSANMAAQAGVFTLLRQTKTSRTEPFQGPEDLDEYFLAQATCPLVKVTLPVDEAPELLLLCQKYGVTAATVYPDYYGAARACMDMLRCEHRKRKAMK